MANLDVMQRFNDQNADHRLDSCIGESLSDIGGNFLKILCDPNYCMATSFYIQGKPAVTTGTNLFPAMLGTIAYGLLPESDIAPNSGELSELQADSINSYSEEEKQEALLCLLPSGIPKQLSSYTDIIFYLSQYQIGVPVIVQWHDEFDNPSGGVLSIPTTSPVSNHCITIYELTEKGLRFKPWLGSNYGNAGYGYLPLPVFNKIFLESYGFVPGNRTLTLLYIALWRISIYLTTMRRV